MKTICITLLAALLLLAACSGPGAEPELDKNGAWVNEASGELEPSALKTAQATNLSGARRSVKNYYLNVPANAKNLKITTSGGSGDVDLYVRHGSRPAGRNYDCRSIKNSNNDACSFAKPKTGRYYITLYGAAAYRGVTLRAVFDDGKSKPPAPKPNPPAPKPEPKPEPKPNPGPSNGYYVQAVYLLPRNAPTRNRSAVMLEATKKIQKQWASWNWTFDLKPNILTLNLPETCGYYSARPRVYERIHPHVTAELKRRGLFSEKAKYIMFAECIREDGVAAWGGGNRATMLEGVLNKIQLNDNSSSNRSATGAIGHELGHTFSLPHENCNGQNPSNGRPSSNGPMCNGKGNWPNVSPAPYQRDLVRQKGCNWIRECTSNAQRSDLSTQMGEYLDSDTFLDSDGNLIWRN